MNEGNYCLQEAQALLFHGIDVPLTIPYCFVSLGTVTRGYWDVLFIVF
jgi:hypothetical protein